MEHKAPKNSDINNKLDKMYDLGLIEQTLRKNFNKGSLDFPLDEIPEGMQYGWVATAIYTEPIPNAESKAHNNFWRKVPQERHPSHPVVVGNQVLHEIPLDIWKVYKKIETEEANKQTQPMQQYTSGGSNPIQVDSHSFQAGGAGEFGKATFGR